jgi:hypothetical protein
MIYSFSFKCEDINLVDMPGLIDIVNKHLYHVAFFIKHNILAFDELTWDYGTDFMREDPELPSFTCTCGSSMCRDGVSIVIDLDTKHIYT